MARNEEEKRKKMVMMICCRVMNRLIETRQKDTNVNSAVEPTFLGALFDIIGCVYLNWHKLQLYYKDMEL